MSLLHVLVLSGVLEPQMTIEEIYDAWRQLPADRHGALAGEPIATPVVPDDAERAAASCVTFWSL